MRQFQRIFLTLFGVTAIFIAVLHVALGPAAIPGSVPVNATMDSEDRFYAILFLAYGAVLIWCAREIGQRGQTVYFLALILFVGGLARLVSMAAVGPPNGFFVAMTALELLLPVVMALVQRQLSSAA